MTTCQFCRRRETDDTAFYASNRVPRCERCRRICERAERVPRWAIRLSLAAIPLILIVFGFLHFAFYNEARFLVGGLGFVVASLCICFVPVECKLAVPTYLWLNGITPPDDTTKTGKAPSGRRSWLRRFASPKTRLAIYGTASILYVVFVWLVLIRGTPTQVMFVKPNVERLAFSPDGFKLFVSGTGDRGPMTEVWDWKAERSLELHVEPGIAAGDGHPTYGIMTVASPDGSLRAVTMPDGQGSVIDRSGQTLRRFERIGKPLAISPDGKWLVCSEVDAPGTLRMWNIGTGDPVATFRVVPAGHYASEVRDVHFTPDGKRMLTTFVEGAFQAWDPQTGELLRTLVDDTTADRSGGTASLSSITFDPSGKCVAALYRREQERSASIVIWNLESGKIIKTLPTPYLNGQTWNTLTTLAFSPDGKTLASGSMRRGPVSDQYTTYTGDWPAVWDAPLYIWSVNLR